MDIPDNGEDVALQFSAQGMLSIMPAAALFFEVDGRIRHVNALFEERFDSNNYVGESVFDIVQQENEVQLDDYVVEALRQCSTDKSASPEIRVELIAGEAPFVVTTCKNASGACAGFLACLERFRYEPHSEYLHDALAAGKVGLWHYDLADEIPYQSRSWWMIRGYNAQPDKPFVWSEWIERVHPDDRREFLALDMQQDSVFTSRYRERHRDGHWIWILSRGRVSIRDQDGLPLAKEGFDTDITEMVEAEEARTEMALQLSHAQRLQSVGQLSGGVAHDFNNLLSVILGSAQLLEAESAESCEHLRNIIDAATRGSKLTQHLLAFSRKQALHPEPLDVSQLLRDMRYMIWQAVGSEVTVEINSPTDQWPCYVDGLQLKNAILNLALNAGDAMPVAGQLKINTANRLLDRRSCAHLEDVQPGEYVMIEVIDTGVGIEPQVVSQAFEPFFTTKEAGKGSGLGLSMVSGFVKQSGGHVELRSTPGNGTRVRLLLPRSKVTAECAEEPAAGPRQAARDTRSLIAVVEDDLSVQQVVVSILETLGYQPLAFSSGAEALAALNHVENLDLLLSDIRLTDGMDGRELGAVLLRRYSQLKIVYMSGYVDNDMRESGLDSCAWPRLDKPFTVDQLAKVVADSLSPASDSVARQTRLAHQHV